MCLKFNNLRSNRVFTIRNEVAKVMFLQVSVCPLGGGGGWYPIMPCRWYPSMPCSKSPGGCYPSMHCRWYPACLATGLRGGGGSAPKGCLVLEGSAPRGDWCPSMHWGRPPPGRDGYYCGRYASHWNAFLFNNRISEHRYQRLSLRYCFFSSLQWSTCLVFSSTLFILR